MPDMDKVIKGLQCCTSPVTMCSECPYEGWCNDVKQDALDILIEIKERSKTE